MQRIIVYFAFKIKDGLYIGNQRSPIEREFILQNKITHVVNCASSQIKINPNQFGLKVLNFDWLDTDEQVILDEANKHIDTIFNFIEEASNEAEGTLVCSFRGQSRALTIITAYLMRKFSWSLYKTLQYMNSKRMDFEIRAVFLKQLLSYEGRLFAQVYCSKDWDDKAESGEALLVRNTFMNTQIKGVETAPKNNSNRVTRIRWRDQLVEVIADQNTPQSKQGRYDDQIKANKPMTDIFTDTTVPFVSKDTKRTKSPLFDPKTVVNQSQMNEFTFQSMEQKDFQGLQQQQQSKQQQPQQQPQQQHQPQQQPQQQAVQYNINLNVSQLNIINPQKVKNNNFTLSTPKFQENSQNNQFDQLSSYLSNQPRPRDSAYNKSRSHSQGFRNQQVKPSTQFQPKVVRQSPIVQQEQNRSVTPDPTAKNQNKNQQQLFEIYLESAPLNGSRATNQFFDSTKSSKPKARPRQLTPIQIKNQSVGPIRSVSQNTKAHEIDYEELNSVKTNQIPLTKLNVTTKNLRGREKKFQIRK